MKPWGTPPTATAAPASPSPTGRASWWPECMADPTASTSPRMTSSSTWRRGVAPVRRDRLPTPLYPRGSGRDGGGRVHRLQAFRFDGGVCRGCPLRSQCIAAKGRKGRRVLIHPQEALLQQARALQQSADYWRQNTGWRGWSSLASGEPATSVGRKRDSSCIWLPRWPT